MASLLREHLNAKKVTTEKRKPVANATNFGVW